MRSLRTVSELTEELRVLPTGMRIIAIDGRCAAGKTTLAARLAKELGGDVIHMDDFFLPPALRTQERRSEPGGNVHYERFLTEVMPKLASGQAFSYQRFDCSRMAPGDWLPVQNNGFVFVEGAYSCHPVLGEYMDRKVFLDIDHETQTERIQKYFPVHVFSQYRKVFLDPHEERRGHTTGLPAAVDSVGRSIFSGIFPRGEYRLHYKTDERRDRCCISFTRIMRRIPPMA